MAQITLYKYRHFGNEKHLRLLSHRELHFAAPSNFDDPLDCAIPFRVDLGPFEQILDLYTNEVMRQQPELSREEAQVVAQACLEENDPFSPEQVEQFGEISKRIFAEKIGVCSLARNPTSPQMWKEYGNNYTGFCVGLDWDRLIEWTKRLKNEGKGVLALPAVYVDELPVMDIHKHEAAEIWQLSATTKLRDWSPEQEYRLLAIELPDTQLTLDDGVINSVGLGANITRQQRDAVIDLLRQYSYRIPLFQSRKVVAAQNQLEVRFREIDY